MSFSPRIVAFALAAFAPRNIIDASRDWLTSGFTAVSVNVLPFLDAEPLSPQNVACLPSRSQRADGDENSVRTAVPPWCAAYISKTLNTGVVANLSPRVRKSEFRQLTSCAHAAMPIFSALRLNVS